MLSILLHLLSRVEAQSSRMKHRDTVARILAARRTRHSPDSHEIGDVEFQEWSRDLKKHGSKFVGTHFDWWMFPWRARPEDTPRAREYSIDRDDVIELLRVPGFVSNYISAVQILIRLKQEVEIDVVTHAHPARHPKISVSLDIFARVAQEQGQLQEAQAIQEAKAALTKVFGAPNVQNPKEHMI